ncbi:GAF domain-containing protein [Desulfococcus sp.]|uniref:GAF domain-containing protein n=1 Tax=Desulfococcus sp. TaxID=2025834 RepID=UPI0035943C5A
MRSWIRNISSWDSLNRAAIIVSLITGFTGILTFLGSQILSAIILLSVAFTAIVFLTIRNIQHKKRIKKSDAILNEVFDISGNMTGDILKARNDMFWLFNRSDENAQKFINQSLQRCMDSLANIAREHTGADCRAACSVITVKDKSENSLIHTIARSFPEKNGKNNEKELQFPFRLRDLSESGVIRTGKPLIFHDLMKQQNYYNPNPNWALLYRSTVVVPITAGYETDNKYFGFLSVDSKEPNTFRETIVPVLEFYADWCSLLLSHAANDKNA